MTDFHPPQRLLVLLLSLFWTRMGSAAALAERSDFDHCAIAAKGGAFNSVSTVAGQGLSKLAGAVARVSERGLSLVENHLTNFDRFVPTEAMLGRLRETMASGTKVSGADSIFYLHEASEATMMGRGMLYDAAHDAALLKYQVSPFSVYHPQVIQANPDFFNDRWFNFWGVGR
jgi:hypothetical protein